MRHTPQRPALSASPGSGAVYVGLARFIGWGIVAALLLLAVLSTSANDCPVDSFSPCQTIT